MQGLHGLEDCHATVCLCFAFKERHKPLAACLLLLGFHHPGCFLQQHVGQFLVSREWTLLHACCLPFLHRLLHARHCAGDVGSQRTGIVGGGEREDVLAGGCHERGQ